MFGAPGYGEGLVHGQAGPFFDDAVTEKGRVRSHGPESGILEVPNPWNFSLFLSVFLGLDNSLVLRKL